jgi:glycosyltransferase involved in cell wall biosynthesis
MKILLVGNYPLLDQHSMLQFAELLEDSLHQLGHEVLLLQPPVVLGRLLPPVHRLNKWLTYVDRFMLFYPRLRRELTSADVVHVCDQGNAVYVPWLGSRAHAVTCHDVLAICSALGEEPQNPTAWSGRLLQRWILRGLRQARQVVCDSTETREELQRVSGLPDDRVTTVPIGLHYPYSPMKRADATTRLQQLGLDPSLPFFLHVGGNQWYKNRPGVVRIFRALSDLPVFERHALVMVGSEWTADMRAIVQSSKLRERIHELCDVSNDDLRALYSLAEALVFPSWREGFGWPIIEAQACGCPVFASNRPPMTEVGGGAAVYVDPEFEERAAHIIAESLGDRERMVQEGLTNAERFSALDMVHSYLRVWTSMLP